MNKKAKSKSGPRKIRLGLIGAKGRMGREIKQLAAAGEEFVVVAEVGRADSIASLKKADIDVVVDFSTIEAVMLNVAHCVSEKLPILIGVTGLSISNQKKIFEAANEIPLFWAPNMSIGIAIMRRLIQVLGKASGFEFQIIETHHAQKKDKPSGTALSLQKTLNDATKKTWPEPLAIRGGGVIGDHQIFAFADEEVIEISHRAIHRSLFARGALRAAKLLAKRKNQPGFYTIEDVLGSTNE